MKKMTMGMYVEEAIDQSYRNIEDYKALTAPLLTIAKSKPWKRLWLIASGSSYNACFCARPFLLAHLPLQLTIITPYTFTYYEYEIQEDDLVLVITQSGLSTNAIDALKKIKSLGHTAICLTGNIDSDCQEVADVMLDYGVQEELVGYVTKGVTTLCLYLQLFTLAYTCKEALLIELKQAIKQNEMMIEKAKRFIALHYKSFSSMNQVYVCGAGNTQGVAMEGALKIGETIHIPSCYYEVEEFIHGPNLQLTPNYSILLFDDNGETSKHVTDIYRATRAVSDRVYLISNHPLFKDDDHVLTLSNVEGTCCSLAYLPFVQLLSYQISHDMNTSKQHPLLRKFKAIVNAKTNHFVNYDGDE